MTLNRAVTVTIPNPTAAQMIAIAELLDAASQNEVAAEEAAKPKKKRGRPAATVSEEEDEDFGKKELSEEDLEEDEGSDEDSEDADEDSEEPSVTFAEVKAVINKYGEKHPDQMRAILLGFKIKSPKELSATKNEKHWEPIYRKVMAKLKASKKAK